MLTGIFKKQVSKYPINPRFRAYGKARLDIARRAATGSDWDRLWKEPAFPFPFDWGEWWKQCIEYKVEDFAAEVGFYTDILGLPVVAFDPNYAMFTSPAQDFFLAVVPALEPGKSTPPDALRIQFMVADIFETVRELQRRGIVFEQKPQPCENGSSMYITFFRTPNGLCVDLWGIVSQEGQPPTSLRSEVEDPIIPQQRIPEERPSASNLKYGAAYQENNQAEPEGFFEDDEVDENVEVLPVSETGLRFFVEQANPFSEPEEVELTGTPGELNFGVVEPNEASKSLWDTGESDEEEQLEEGEDDFDEEDLGEESESEDDDSSPYEYEYVDDL